MPMVAPRDLQLAVNIVLNFHGEEKSAACLASWLEYYMVTCEPMQPFVSWVPTQGADAQKLTVDGISELVTGEVIQAKRP